MQEFRSDAAIQPNSARHILHIGADNFAQIRHFIDESDLGGEKRVGRIFDQLGGFARREQHRRLIEVKRTVQLAQHRSWPVGCDPAHDAIGAEKIFDRRAFAKEFGIGTDVEIRIRPKLKDSVFDLLPRADRNRRFGDDHRVAVNRGGDFVGCSKDIGQIRMAVAAPRRCADRNENSVSILHAGCDLRGE